MAIKRILDAKQRAVLSTVKTSFLNGLTIAQAETYIDDNVTDLASAKVVLKKMAKLILVLCQKANLQ